MSSSDRNPTGVPDPFQGVTLSLRDWLVAVAVLALVFWITPRLWQRVEKFDATPDARVPYSLGNDYWIYDRAGRQAASEGKCLVIGDSVVWGHYVESGQTLPAHLNRQSGKPQFANLGLDGVHPAAIAGLIEHYGRGISDRKVLLHCNLLWMSSKRHDLRVEKEFSFNHPALVPQLFPRIACYTEPLSGRLAIIVGREIPFFAWARHLQAAYFGNADLPSWTLEHPYANPLSAVTFSLPSPDEPPAPPPVAKPWTQAGLERFHASWVDLDTSFQWRCFQRAVEILQGRGNRVFVVVGPFNEHMLTEDSRRTYQDRLRQVEAWLAQRKIPHRMAPLLPSDEFADASHPLDNGYARLARQLLENEAFRGFLDR